MLPPPPNCKTNMFYKPRSGTFRKVKYPIAIYKEDEIPRKDFEEMLEMANRIKAEDPYQEKCSDVGNEAERKLNIAMRRTMKSDPVNPSLYVKPESTCLQSSSNLPQPEFSLNPVNLYSSVYPDDNSLPPFPVTSCADSNYSSDSEESQCESDYDMDSEDEEWLKKNQELNITPNRLEYIFTKLNKRNTHVPEKAVGALPVTVHSDFYHLFPYWKEKRLLNKNSSSFKRTPQQADGKLALGYVSTDPFVAFAHKVRKPLVQQSPPPSKIVNKIGKQEKAKLCFKRMVELRGKLENLRSFALKLEQKGLADRDRIESKLSHLTIMVSNNENLEQKCKVLPMPTPSIATRITRRSSTDDTRQTLRTFRTNKLERKPSQVPAAFQKLLNPMVFRPQKNKWEFTHSTLQKIPTFEFIFSGKRQKTCNEALEVARGNSNVEREP